MMGLMLRIRQKIKFQISSVASSFSAWFWDSSTTNTSTKIVDKTGTGTRDVQTGRCYLFDGVDDYVLIGDTTEYVKSISFKIKPNDITAHTDYVFDLNGTDFITILNGAITLNGFSGATTNVYVDGVSTNVISNITDFHSVVITSDTGFLASGLNIGRINPLGFFDGSMFDVRFFTSELSSDERTLIDDFGSVTNNLIGWYKMDEQSGSTSYDSNAGTNNGTITNATLSAFHSENIAVLYSFQNELGYSLSGNVFIPRNELSTTNDVLSSPLGETGRVKYSPELVGSNCADFDGTNDYAEVPHHSDFTFTDNFTVTLLVSFDSLSRWDGIFTMQNTSTFKGFSIQKVESNDKIRINIGTGSSNSFGIMESDSALAANNWYRITLIRESGTLKLYIDGTLQTGTTATAFSANNEGLRIGESYLNSSLPMDGQVCDVRIYDTVKTHNEIEADNSTDLVLNIPFSEGAGIFAYDISGNGNHATLQNITESTFWGNSQNLIHRNITLGCNREMYFNGSTDYINVPDSDDIEGMAELTLSVWFTPKEDASVFFPRILNKVHHSAYQIAISRVNKYVYAYINGAIIQTPNDVITFGSLHHVVFTYNSGGTGTGKIYVNAVEEVADTTYVAANVGTNTSPLIIGADDAFGNKLTGSIHSLAIWDKELTSGEVSALYAKTSIPTNTQASNLKAYFLNSGNTDSNWVDQSANSNNGTVVGSPKNIYYPSKIDLSEDVLTNPLNNPAGKFHNGSETKIKFTAAPELLICDANDFLFNSSGVPNELGYDDFVKDVNDEHKIMMDISTENQKKNLVLYNTPLSGGDLTKTQTYLNH